MIMTITITIIVESKIFVGPFNIHYIDSDFVPLKYLLQLL